MQLSNLPARILRAFAQNGSKRTIPVDSQIGVTPGAASFNDGFPPLTMTPLNAGGVAPFGVDFNGTFNAITAIQRWQSGGGLFTYDAAWSAENTGYPLGALLLKADGSGYWRNLIDNNTSNPDSGGANWTGIAPGGLLNHRVITTSGTYTPTPGTKAIRVTVQGAGGGGGGTQATGAGQVAGAPGGNSGATAQSYLTSGFSGAAMTVGAGGGGGGAGGGGAAGGNSSFILGAVSIVAPGGQFGSVGTPVTPPFLSAPGINTTVATGGNIFNGATGCGQAALLISTAASLSGAGGDSPYGHGPRGNAIASVGGTAVNYGCGGSGALSGASDVARAGGAGASGAIFIEEFA